MKLNTKDKDIINKQGKKQLEAIQKQEMQPKKVKDRKKLLLEKI